MEKFPEDEFNNRNNEGENEWRNNMFPNAPDEILMLDDAREKQIHERPDNHASNPNTNDADEEIAYCSLWSKDTSVFRF